MTSTTGSGGQHEAVNALRAYFGVVWSRKWLVLLALAVTVGSGLLFIQLQTPVYRAGATVLIEPETPKVVNIQEVTPGTGPTQDYYATQTKLIQSRPIVDAVIARLKLKERIPELAETRDTYGAFLALLTVEALKNTRLVVVNFDSSDPKLAAEVANGLGEEYVRYNLALKHQMSKEAASWLNEQVGGLVAKADRSAADLQSYQTKADLLGIQEQRQVTTQKIMDTNRAFLEAQTQRSNSEAKLRELSRILKDPLAADAVFTVVDDPMVRKLKGELSDLLAERSKLLESYGPRYPDVLQVEGQIKHANARIREEVGKLQRAVENEYQVAKAREANVAANLGELRRDAQQLASKEARALSLQRDKDSSEEILSTVVKRMKETGLTMGLDATNIRIVEPAAAPPFPIKPRRRIIQMVSVVLGLGLGVGLAFVAESLDNRIRSPQDVERAVEVPVLGVVPVFKIKRRA